MHFQPQINTHCSNYYKSEFTYKKLYLDDSPTEDITSLFYNIFDFLENAFHNRGKVYVHCKQGVSRSTAFVIGYLMWKQNRIYDITYDEIRNKRDSCNPNAGFVCQLKWWWRRSHEQKQIPKLFRIAPHSAYKNRYTLHTLVAKLICDASGNPIISPKYFDPRTCFVIQIQDKVFIWKGLYSNQLQYDAAKHFIFSLHKYEQTPLPEQEEDYLIEQGKETQLFWPMISASKDEKIIRNSEYNKDYPDKIDISSTEEPITSSDDEPSSIHERKTFLFCYDDLDDDYGLFDLDDLTNDKIFLLLTRDSFHNPIIYVWVGSATSDLYMNNGKTVNEFADELALQFIKLKNLNESTKINLQLQFEETNDFLEYF